MLDDKLPTYEPDDLDLRSHGIAPQTRYFIDKIARIKMPPRMRDIEYVADDLAA